MEEKLKFGIGFVTGRANVCEIINNYYKAIIEQVRKYTCKVDITIYILYDTTYQNCKKEEFYHILPEAHEQIKIKYISPEAIEEEIVKVSNKNQIDKEKVSLFLGHGHAKARNTVMYYAVKDKIDYLLFWDDDEYPVAIAKDNGRNVWIKQENILKHIEYMEKENADVTIGYHCGYISPIPWIEYNENFTEQDMKEFIEVISNEIISWESIKDKMKNNNGVTYADLKKAKEIGAYEIESQGIGKWVSGSTLCLNLNHKDKIPAFYNPPLARGEDTFFSTQLANAKVFKIPVYHFHDGFLKYREIMEEKYPKCLRKISAKEQCIDKRFLSATSGWIKYKPLLLYISNQKNYKNEIEKMRKKLAGIIPKLNYVFENDAFSVLLEELEKYDRDVEKHYEDYKITNDIWNILKNTL